MGHFIFNNCKGIEGLYHIIPRNYSDERGYNYEVYNEKLFFDAGLNMKFVQINQSMSKKGVIRGMHFQKIHQQGKLVRVVSGKVFDVAVDVRENSKTYSKWYGEYLSAEKKNMLYVPEGFAHGFLVLSDVAVFVYQLTDYYYPEDEGGIPWNDPTIGIDWPITKEMMISISERDNQLPHFSDSTVLKPKNIFPT